MDPGALLSHREACNHAKRMPRGWGKVCDVGQLMKDGSREPVRIYMHSLVYTGRKGLGMWTGSSAGKSNQRSR